MDPLEKVLRLAQQGDKPEAPSQDSRPLARVVQAAHAALIEACATEDPEMAAKLVYAAAGLVEDLAASFQVDELEDWVEATAAPDGSQLLLAGASAPYGDVPYADPGYLDGKKRYPIDEKHVKAAWSYINQAKNASRYTAAQLSNIKGKIKKAMKSHGHGKNIDATHPHEFPVALANASSPKAGQNSHSAMTGTHSHEHTHAGDTHSSPNRDSTSGPSKGLDAAAAGTRRTDTGQSAAAAASRNMSFSALEMLRDGEAGLFLAAPPHGDQDIPMHHAPFTGTHSHAHVTTMAHGHAHSHSGDNDHRGNMHGSNQKEKSWAPKGQHGPSRDYC